MGRGEYCGVVEEVERGLRRSRNSSKKGSLLMSPVTSVAAKGGRGLDMGTSKSRRPCRSMVSNKTSKTLLTKGSLSQFSTVKMVAAHSRDPA
jgi:hypothetical protein